VATNPENSVFVFKVKIPSLDFEFCQKTSSVSKVKFLQIFNVKKTTILKPTNPENFVFLFNVKIPREN
jgi:hypothetical protein